MDKKMFTPEDIWKRLSSRQDYSFTEGPEMAARQRLAKLREKKRAYGPQLTRTQEPAFRLLTLLYPPSPYPPDEITLADDPFRDLPIAKDDTLSSPKPPNGPTSTNSNLTRTKTL